MVKAILEGRKTQTRRVVKFPKHTYEPIGEADWVKSVHQDGGGNWIAWSTAEPGLAEFTKKAYPKGEGFKCPYGVPGDKLWVKETWQQIWEAEDGRRFTFAPPYISVFKDKWIEYAATPRDEQEPPTWRPSIFMPRWASRLTLEVTAVRVERLQDISEADAIAEGCKPWIENGSQVDSAVNDFGQLWDEINEERGYAWRTNPWVWVVEFRKV